MTIRDAFLLRDHTETIGGVAFTLRRPSALDVLEALEVGAKTPTRVPAWLVWRHLVEDGKPVFASMDEVLAADGVLVARIAEAAERLYTEGRD